MTPIVADTDVVSYVFKNHSRAPLYLPYFEERPVLISFMTEAELEHWVLRSEWGARRQSSFREFMKRFVVVHSSRELVLRWAELMHAAARRGRRMEPSDAWIAATAVLYQVPLLTHNRADYAGVPGLTIEP